ncbi:unnamed protein product [Lepeophtheirus salmonis]|uniref:(salmon louse) hypothetical protein n=1 Tax=Lepeophtheirus salmonis TaxID=72036 RepID=A0A7R8CRU8_LEPSM|nr:unnamed protein product [Lepeophtheirus salmonis]CAF2910763.1 unnamed protein product [Lepeophtheirus salmonis]
MTSTSSSFNAFDSMFSWPNFIGKQEYKLSYIIKKGLWLLKISLHHMASIHYLSEGTTKHGFVPKILSKKRVRLSASDNGQASTSKRHVRSGEVLLFKDRSPAPVPPKSNDVTKTKNSVSQQIIETIVLDSPEDAEVVEGPMDIATSPAPAGPLQDDNAFAEGDRTPQPLTQSPTPQEVRAESIDLLQHIRVMKQMMGSLTQEGDSSPDEGAVVSAAAPDQPDPEDLKLLEDKF